MARKGRGGGEETMDGGQPPLVLGEYKGGRPNAQRDASADASELTVGSQLPGWGEFSMSIRFLRLTAFQNTF